MSFQPRHLADGRVCCSQEYALCDTCKGLRAAAATDYTPPDPYQKGIAEMRGETPARKAPEAPKGFEPPNPYTQALEELRRSEQR